jgi:hypothetical protein
MQFSMRIVRGTPQPPPERGIGALVYFPPTAMPRLVF